jgi:phosphoribosyl-dephospho-CoA transferase
MLTFTSFMALIEGLAMRKNFFHDDRQTVPRPHDLLWMSGLDGLASDQPSPSWATAEWLACAPLVIRREKMSDAAWLPVGLRGKTRSERFKALLSRDTVAKWVSPEFLVRTEAWSAHPQFSAFPAVRALACMASLLTGRDLRWGPTGSVGFALASGLPVLREESDLDVVVRASEPLRVEQIALLHTVQSSRLCRIDIQIDTGNGGFAFAEWIRGRKTVLLKTDIGPVLSADPWAPLNAVDAAASP